MHRQPPAEQAHWQKKRKHCLHSLALSFCLLFPSLSLTHSLTMSYFFFIHHLLSLSLYPLFLFTPSFFIYYLSLSLFSLHFLFSIIWSLFLSLSSHLSSLNVFSFFHIPIQHSFYDQIWLSLSQAASHSLPNFPPTLSFHSLFLPPSFDLFSFLLTIQPSLSLFSSFSLFLSFSSNLSSLSISFPSSSSPSICFFHICFPVSLSPSLWSRCR